MRAQRLLKSGRRGRARLQHDLLDERQDQREGGQAAHGHADAEHLLRRARRLVRQVLPEHDREHLRARAPSPGQPRARATRLLRMLSILWPSACQPLAMLVPDRVLQP